MLVIQTTPKSLGQELFEVRLSTRTSVLPSHRKVKVSQKRMRIDGRLLFVILLDNICGIACYIEYILSIIVEGDLCTHAMNIVELSLKLESLTDTS